MPQTVILKEAVVCIATHAKFLEGRLLDPITEMAGHRLERQSRGNLYGAFIEQNVDASRILIVESAFDPRNPTRARRAGASEPGQRVGVAILVFGSI